MKEKLFIMAVLLGGSGLVHAQSSVTLYGIINEAITYSSNQGGHSAVQLTGNGEYGSRWGLRGAEDLGGNTKAIFTLENGFNPTNGALGQNNRMFGRQAFVGFSNPDYGTLTFGRQYDAIVGTLQTMTSNGAWGGVMFSHPYDNDNTDDYLRVNNSIKYVSPSLKGFTGTAMYAFSNAPGAFANNRMWSVGGIYSQGAFSIAAAYSLYDRPGVNTTANVNTNGAITCCDAPITSEREQIAGIGASYVIGPAKLSLMYSNAIYNNVGTTLTSGINYRFNNYEANARFTLDPTLFFGMAYTYTSDNITGGPGGPTQVHWHQVNLLVDKFLSKRTSMYTEVIYLRAAGGGFPRPTGGPLPATSNGMLASQIQTMLPSSGQNQAVVSVGLVHKF
ncbi:putative porin [Paraburkholderia sp. BL6665CI2N2]|uniref:porin n=1 Tax=Paraburkholderia sp. BL6665CI2N2 TaxID=1938806 RepID=UPI001066D6FC|nr:porin [Paraburkholderia sp. BL6665CI2N2]TDY23360.1 putative porin [Paraburkholderia sp. BL6665CI2N2]